MRKPEVDAAARQQRRGLEQRQTDDAGVAALDLLDEHGRVPLNAVAARLVERLAGPTISEPLGGGRFVVAAQDDSSVSVLDRGQITKVLTGIQSPGDIGWDYARGRVFVPLLDANQVMIWQLP